MPSYTPKFRFGYFDLGDDLADLNNSQIDMDRFVILDEQLYGLYSIFGSGTIDGWVVEAPATQNPSNITVNVTSGLGIINLYATETLFDVPVENLPPNQTCYIYAQTVGLTPLTRAANFYYQRTLGSQSAILLARVTTGSNGIVSIDNTVRKQIGFQAEIDAAIAAHHHRGSPTKIDLATETQGQLPGNKIGDLSATQITTGVLNPARLPAISHTALKDIGEFSHIAIDAMLRKITPQPTDQLMGVVALVNQLKGDIYDKYLFPDKDKYLENELLFIAGVSPDSYVDWANCTANVNTESNCISGLPVYSGQIVNVLWNNSTSFGGAYQQTNVTINTLGVTIQQGSLISQLVEGFNEAADGDLLSSFVASLQSVNDTTGVYADASNEVDNAAFAGMFHVEQSIQAVFTKTFDTPQDWSSFNTLSVYVKCDDLTHGQVYMYYQTSTGYQSSPFLLLDVNEVTTSSDPTLKGFEQRIMSLVDGELGDVSALVIYTDDVQNDYTFWLDNITLGLSQNYLPQGSIRLRYSTGQQVTFNSLAYDTVLPVGTNIQARIRVADSENDLDAALFSQFLNPDATFSFIGQAAEVEVVLFSDVNQMFTPTLKSVELSLNTSAEEQGITIDSYNDWSQGTLSNLSLANTVPDATVSIASPIAVNDLIYLSNGVVGELNSGEQPVFSITGQNVPPSEVQAYANIFGSPQPGLPNARSIVRTPGRQYIVCDTYNHRIITFDGQGNIVSMYSGFNDDIDTTGNDVVGLTATYNETTGILYLGFSKTLTCNYTDLSKIKLTIGANFVSLTEEGSVLAEANAPSTTMIGRVLAIPLSTDHQSMLVGNEAKANITFSSNFISGFNQTYAGKPIQVYACPVTYYQYIYYPVYAAPSAAGNLWICNATQLPFVTNADGSVTEPTPPTTYNLQEYSPTVQLNNYTNNVSYSLTFGGSVFETPSGELISCGLNATRVGQVVLNPLGQAKVIYTSPYNNQPTQCDMDSNGYLWVAESSGTTRAGRILKMDLNGNILTIFNGVYTAVNNIQVLENDDLLVST